MPALEPSFADTRTVTHSIDCLRAGQDPYTERSFDPWHRLYNYPPIWLDLRYLGVSSRATNAAGIVFAFLAAGALLLLFDARRLATWIVSFLAVTSLAFLYAVERGNIDLVVFALLTIGLLLVDRLRQGTRPLSSALLIVLMTVLKIFPIASVVVLLRNRRSIWKVLATGALALAALVLTSGHRLSQVLANTPEDLTESYGALPFFYTLSHRLSPALGSMIQNHRVIASIGAVILGVLSIAVGLIYRERLYRFVPRLDFGRPRGQIAIACSAIFCLTFLRGANYDYRLIFLLGVVAYLVEDMNAGQSLRSLPSCIILLFYLWFPFHPNTLHEILDGLIFAGSCAWLGTALLDNMRGPLLKPLP